MPFQPIALHIHDDAAAAKNTVGLSRKTLFLALFSDQFRSAAIVFSTCLVGFKLT